MLDVDRSVKINQSSSILMLIQDRTCPTIQSFQVNPNQASPASGAWLHNATPEDVHNLTVPVKIKGKKVPFKCNKSCPPQEVACGLDQRGLHRGVM